MTPAEYAQQLRAAADELDRKDTQIDGLLKLIEELEAVIADQESRHNEEIAALQHQLEDALIAVDAFINSLPSAWALKAEEN